MTGHILDGVTCGLIAVGVFLVFAGAVGLLRFPDFYTRMHAAGVTDTLGAELIILGLILQAPDWITGVKLALIALFLFFTSPTATHATASAAYAAGLKPLLGPWRAPGAGATKTGEDA